VLLAGLLFFALQQGRTGRVEITVRDATTRESITGVRVTLTAEPAGPSEIIATDSRGLATFPALTPGNYRIQFPADRVRVEAYSDYVRVDPGSQNSREFFLKSVASVIGRVANADATPSAAAALTLHSTSYLNGRQTLSFVARATTDLEGRFGFQRVPSGDYYLRIETPQSNWSIAYYPGETDLSVARKIPVRDQDVLLSDISLPGVSRFKISGTVTFPGAVSNRALRFTATRDYTTLLEDPFSLAPQLLPSNVPNESRFEFDGLPRGTWVLFFTNGAGLLARETIVISDSDVRDLRIVMKPTIGIRGKVLSNDSTRLPESLRIASTAREFLPATATPVDMLSREATAISRNGEFVARNLMEGGRYGIFVGNLPADAYVADIRLGPRSIFNEGSFIASASQDSLEVYIGSSGGTVKGVVRDTAGQSVPAASVVVVPDFSLRQNALLYKRITADARGQFVVRGLAPGDYQLFAWLSPPPQGAEEDPIFLGPFESRSVRVRAASGVTTETNLRLIQ
jgi:hypothetical protein